MSAPATPPLTLSLEEIDEIAKLESVAAKALDHWSEAKTEGSALAHENANLIYFATLGAKAPSLLSMARRLVELESALEYLLIRDNWYLKNTCGISYPCHNGAESCFTLARERGWDPTKAGR